MITFSDTNEKTMCDDVYEIPNVSKHSKDKAIAVHTTYTNRIGEYGLSNPTQGIPINPKTVQEGSSYIHMDTYIDMLTDDESSEVGISNTTDVISIRSAKTNQSSANAPEIYERIKDINDLVNCPSIYEVIMNEAELDVESTYDNNIQTGIDKDSTDPLHTAPLCTSTNRHKQMIKVQPASMRNKCKLALALLGLVIAVAVVCLIVWGVKSRVKENIKVEPAINMTSAGFRACLNNSVNFSDCNIQEEKNTNSKNISLLMLQERSTISSQYNTLPETGTSAECWDT